MKYKIHFLTLPFLGSFTWNRPTEEKYFVEPLLPPLGAPKEQVLLKTGAILILWSKIVQETCVCFHSNNSEGVTKVTQIKTKYEQFLT